MNNLINKILLFACFGLLIANVFADDLKSGKVTVNSPETSKQEIIKQRKENRSKLKEKATALVEKMTLDEKLALVDMNSRPVERFDIPAHHWWNEALSGVGRNGSATQFPQSIAMASTWNPMLIEEMAFAISSEARAKYHAANEPTGRYRGLTIWSPTINLARDPRWGRNEETFGEDPWLTSRIALGFVKGLQGYDSQYLKTVATVKHFIANNHEYGRTTDRPDVPEQFLRDYYMIPYKAAVEEAGVQSIMTAYSGINDIPCTIHKWLLTDVLRHEWGFDGTIVTDVGAPEYLSSRHKVTANQTESSAEMIKAGVNVICHFNDFRAHVKAAIEDGLITEEQLEQAVIQNMTTRMELGQVIDDNDNPYKNIPISVVGSSEHRAIARKIAQQGTILLKNENDLLPINTEKFKRIVVTGPYGNVAPLGGYSGPPTITPITPLAGITKVASELGVEVINRTSGDEYATIPSAYFRPAEGVDGTIGLRGEYFLGTELSGPPSASRLDQNIAFNWPKPIENIDPLIPQPEFSVRWTGKLVPDRTGEFRLAVDSDDGVRVWLEDNLIIDDWQIHATKRNESQTVYMKSGNSYDIRVEYFDAGGEANVNLLWMVPPEGEEKKYDPNTTMFVYVGGFDIEDADESRDLMNLELKKNQLEDLQELYSEYPNTVMILNGGTIVPSDWLYENIPAIMHAWYPGQEGGDALADLLFGKVSPSGHLPITSYASADNLPPIKDYDLSKGRTYMYHDKPVTFPFGHGLSYTEFSYGEISSDTKILSANEPRVTIEVPITNTGDMTSDDVVQVYIKDLSRNPDAYNPKKQLCGFQRISLNPGETKQVTIKLDKRVFSYWDVVKKEYIFEPGAFEIQVGTSSEDIQDKVIVQVGETLGDCPSDTLFVGDTWQLFPYYSDDKTVSWKSSDESVATVDSTGMVTAISEGAATITLTTNDGEFIDACEINSMIEVIKVYGLTMGNCPPTLLHTGNILQLTANVAPENATDKLVTWNSSNPEVATVDENGLVSAVSQGSVKIRVTTNDGGYSTSCNVGVILSTGLQAHRSNQAGIKIYPNPTKDKLHIEFLKEDDLPREIQIFNNKGQVIFKEYAHGLQKIIDVKKLKAIGLVAVQIKTSTSSTVHKISLL